MKREFCCSECGLIWFNEYEVTSQIKCPECGNYMGKIETPIFACDTTGWCYSSLNVVKSLKKRDKKIHYYKDHPWFHKNK